MTESFIENVHREDLNIEEKGKYLAKIIKVTGWSNIEIANKLQIAESAIRLWLSTIPNKELLETGRMKGVNEHTTLEIAKDIEDKKTQKELINYASKKEIGTLNMRKVTKIVKDSTPDVKEALLNDKINVEQAERISKLKTEDERDE